MVSARDQGFNYCWWCRPLAQVDVLSRPPEFNGQPAYNLPPARETLPPCNAPAPVMPPAALHWDLPGILLQPACSKGQRAGERLQGVAVYSGRRWGVMIGITEQSYMSLLCQWFDIGESKLYGFSVANGMFVMFFLFFYIIILLNYSVSMLPM